MGRKLVFEGDEIRVPNRPIIPFIEGDGIGPDIWRAAQRVLDASVEKAYQNGRSIAWMEIFAGEKAKDQFDEWLPDETVRAISDYSVAIKGPLTTSGGRRDSKSQCHPAPGSGPLRPVSAPVATSRVFPRRSEPRTS